METFYYVLLGYTLDFFFNALILLFGVNLIKEALKKDNEIQKQYSFGLGMFFASVASSALVYGIDLASRQFFDGKRIFPAKYEYIEMGLIFDSIHIESYYIVILTFMLISVAALVFPIEKYMIGRGKPLFSKIAVFLSPVPIIIRILERITLPQEGSILYWIYSGLFILVWLVIGISILMMLFVYSKIAKNAVGDVRKRSIVIIVSIMMWLLVYFQRPDLLKGLDNAPLTFWVAPLLELVMLGLFLYGFAQNIEVQIQKDEHRYLYQNWFFKVVVWGLLLALAIYFSIIFWVKDIELSIYWTTRAETDVALKTFADFMDRSMFEGGSFGGQDVSYLFLIPMILIYFLSYVPALNEKLGKFRKYGGFAFAATVVLALVNRAAKGYFSRVRPSTGNVDLEQYSNMFEWGSLSLSKGLSSGSFTSGHTTTAAIVIIFAFILIGTHKSWAIIPAFVLSIGWTILMGFGRVVEKKHYPSDTLWALVISIWLIAGLYFYVFKIPDQEEGTFIPRAKFAEFRWTILSAFFIIFIFLFLVGIKYSILEFEWYWPLASVLAIPLSYFTWKRMKFIMSG